MVIFRSNLILVFLSWGEEDTTNPSSEWKEDGGWRGEEPAAAIGGWGAGETTTTPAPTETTWAEAAQVKVS